MSKAGKPRLGRGLSSLIGMPVSVDPPQPTDPSDDVPMAPVEAPDMMGSEAAHADRSPEAVESREGLIWLSVGAIEANPYQPRRVFDGEALAELAASIRQAGVMQPIVVRPTPNHDGRAGRPYQIVAGERRWRAAKLAELDQLPAIVRELDDHQIAEWAVIENLQREDLNPIEKAQAFARLIEHFELRHEDIADRVGVNRSTVTNTLRLLDLHSDVRDLIQGGMLTAGHAKALLAIADADAQAALGRQIIAAGWSVRMTEAEVRRLTSPTPDESAPADDGGASAKQKSRPRNAAHLEDLQRQVAEQLGTKVKIKAGRKKGSGSITIDFYDLDQFDGLLNQLGVTLE